VWNWYIPLKQNWSLATSIDLREVMLREATKGIMRIGPERIVRSQQPVSGFLKRALFFESGFKISTR
jgi:hypothetical protein